MSKPIAITVDEARTIIDDGPVENGPNPDVELHIGGRRFRPVEVVQAADSDDWGAINWSIIRRASDDHLFAMPWHTNISEVGTEAALEVRIGSSPWGPVLVPVTQTGTRVVGIYEPVAP